MSFTPLQKHARERTKERLDGVSIACRKVSPQRLGVFIYIPKKWLDALGMQAGGHLRVLLGHDSDYGRLALEPASKAKGYRISKASTKGAGTIAVHALRSAEPQGAKECRCEMVNGRLLIDLPKWAHPDQYFPAEHSGFAA